MRQVVLIVVLATLAAGCGEVTVETRDATADIESLLLGDEGWIGSGEYELLASAAADDHSSENRYTVTAARIRLDGGEEVTLFWRQDSGGLLIGDATTRSYSVWGSEATVGSPVDELVEDAKDDPAGQAVLDAVTDG